MQIVATHGVPSHVGSVALVLSSAGSCSERHGSPPTPTSCHHWLTHHTTAYALVQPHACGEAPEGRAEAEEGYAVGRRELRVEEAQRQGGEHPTTKGGDRD